MENDIEIKLMQERELARFNAINQIGISMITMGQNAIKSAMLINGGAAVALLAFMGNIWDKSVCHKTAILLANSIGLFAIGVLFAALGSGATYCSQHLLLTNDYKKYGRYFQGLSIFLVIYSYFLFGWASWCAYNAFLSHY